MIAVDTNLLVYAHREDSPWHDAASARLAELAEARGPLGDSMAVTARIPGDRHASKNHAPTTLAAAIDQVDAWLESPSLTLLAESEGYWQAIKAMVRGGRIAGPHVHDARVAALCRLHGVRELWTADRDFSRFRGLEFRNPLVP